ncbi:MAG: ECF-type sigma factor [Planctomycetota bacterium]|jgi:RNA polymerase sigma factor (TIGR02999 family)
MWSAEFEQKTYLELRDLAEAQFRRGPNVQQTLQPTALVNEAYLRLAKWSGEYNDREHFLATAATVMRQLLVDRARARGALKRGGGQVQVELSDLDLYESSCGDLVEFDELLTLLEEQDAQLARIVELRFFGGLTEQETANSLDVSVSTVTRGFKVAKNWLKARLDEREEG